MPAETTPAPPQGARVRGRRRRSHSRPWGHHARLDAAGVLDQPIEVVAGASRVEVGRSLTRRWPAAQERLAQAEEGVAIVGLVRRAPPKVAHGGDIATAQRQPAAEPRQRRVTRRAFRQQAIGKLDRAAVDCQPGPGRAGVEGPGRPAERATVRPRRAGRAAARSPREPAGASGCRDRSAASTRAWPQTRPGPRPGGVPGTRDRGRRTSARWSLRGHGIERPDHSVAPRWHTNRRARGAPRTSWGSWRGPASRAASAGPARSRANSSSPAGLPDDCGIRIGVGDPVERSDGVVEPSPFLGDLGAEQALGDGHAMFRSRKLSEGPFCQIAGAGRPASASVLQQRLGTLRLFCPGYRSATRRRR